MTREGCLYMPCWRVPRNAPFQGFSGHRSLRWCGCVYPSPPVFANQKHFGYMLFIFIRGETNAAALIMMGIGGEGMEPEILSSTEPEATERWMRPPAAKARKSAGSIAKPEEMLRLFTAIARRDESVYSPTINRVKSKRSYVDEEGNKVSEDRDSAEVLWLPPDIREVMKAAEVLLSAYEKLVPKDTDAAPGLVEIPARLPE